MGKRTLALPPGPRTGVPGQLAPNQRIQGSDLTQLAESYETAENEAGYQSTFGSCRDIADRLIEKYGVGRG